MPQHALRLTKAPRGNSESRECDQGRARIIFQLIVTRRNRRNMFRGSEKKGRPSGELLIRQGAPDEQVISRLVEELQKFLALNCGRCRVRKRKDWQRLHRAATLAKVALRLQEAALVVQRLLVRLIDLLLAEWQRREFFRRDHDGQESVLIRPEPGAHDAGQIEIIGGWQTRCLVVAAPEAPVPDAGWDKLRSTLRMSHGQNMKRCLFPPGADGTAGDAAGQS